MPEGEVIVMRVKRVPPLLLFLVACLSLPLCCCPTLPLINNVNPIHLFFLVEFRVNNESDETVYITPVGTMRTLQKQRYVLSRASPRLPGTPALRQGDIRLDPGESVRIIYDDEDIAASEIAVRNAQGEYRQLVISGRQKRLTSDEGMPENVYTIRSFDRLSKIAPEVLAVVKEAGRSNRGVWIWMALLVVPGLIPIALLLVWSGLALKVRRESRDAERVGAPMGGESPDSQPRTQGEGFVSSLKTKLTRKPHLLAVLLAGLPLALGLCFLLISPDYIGRLILPNETQPIGWFMTAAILILTGMAYLGPRMGFALWNRPEPRSWALDFVNGGLFMAGVLCPFFAMCLIAFGPAILIVQAGMVPLEVF
jgi:hypothetical protein